MVQTELIDSLEFLGGVFVEIEEQYENADLSGVTRELIETLQDKHRAAFDAERSPGGENWPPLAPATVQRKGHDTILVETGRLKRSLAGKTGDSIREQVREPMFHGLSFGTSVEYARYHQDGRGVPQREHVGVDDTTADAIAESAADAVVEALMPRR